MRRKNGPPKTVITQFSQIPNSGLTVMVHTAISGVSWGLARPRGTGHAAAIRGRYVGGSSDPEAFHVACTECQGSVRGSPR